MADSLVRALRATRAGYDEEKRRHRLMMDAYSGTGGFQGATSVDPGSWWGWAADVYAGGGIASAFASTSEREEASTYLDRFPREDLPKFRRRVQTSQYVNHCATVVDVPLSYLGRKEFKRDVPEAVGAWMRDVDGEGTSWEEQLRDVTILRAMTVGYCPVLFEMSGASIELPEGATLAQAFALGVRLNALPLFPGNLLDWSCDEHGVFRWVKIVVSLVDRPSPFEPGRAIDRVTIWYPDRWERYDISRDERGEEFILERDEGTHGFGRVPLEILRWKQVPGDHVRGISALETIASLARRHFNYLSELDEHIRQCVFAMLQVPLKQITADKLNEIVGGSGQALPIPADSNRDYRWITPDSAVSEIIERRLKETRDEIYRQGRIEFTNATNGGQARSGVSRAFEFETANRAIADFAKRIARFEERALGLAARVIPGSGVDASTPESELPIRVVPPDKFSVQELESELSEAQAALDLELGATASAELRKRIVRSVLPNVAPETLEEIDAEIDELADSEAKQGAQAFAALQQIAGTPIEPDLEDADLAGDEEQ